MVYFKRLERGRFQLPAVNAARTSVEMEPVQLAMLLDGIDLNACRLAGWTLPSTKGSTRILISDPTSWMAVPTVDHECELAPVVTGSSPRSHTS